MRFRAIGVALVLTVLLSSLLAGSLPVAAEGDGDAAVFLPLMGDSSVPGLESLTAAIGPDVAGQPSTYSTPSYLAYGSYPSDNACDATIFAGKYMFGLSVLGVSLDGIHTNGELSVELTESGINRSWAWLFFDWELLSIADGQAVGAVIVETGRGASAFEYDPPYTVEDSSLHAPGFYHKDRFFNRKIHKVTFCLVEGGPDDPQLSMQKFTLGAGETPEEDREDANSIEDAAVTGDEPDRRYIVRRDGGPDLLNVIVDDVPETGKGVPFVVNEIANLPDGDPEIRRECRLVDSATYQSWTDPWGFDGFVWDEPGLSAPADLSDIDLTADYPALVCDVDSDGLTTLAQEAIIIEGLEDPIMVTKDTYFNTATVTVNVATETGEVISAHDESHFVSVNCCIDFSCYPYERPLCSLAGQ